MTATYTDTQLDSLIINRMTKNQYDSLPTKSDDELYIITDDDSYEIQVTSMPTANASNEGRIVQFIGTTGTYTNGYYYKCVSDGQNPATYSWTQVNVQPAGSSLPSMSGQSGKYLTNDGSAASWATVDTLPSQTGNSGKFLTTNGSSASWGNALTNLYSSSNSLVILGSITSPAMYSVTVLGGLANVKQDEGVAVGYKAKTGAGIAIGAESNSSNSYHATAVGRDRKSVV